MDDNEKHIREQIITLALDQYKKPYVWGGHGPNNYDCAGLIWYIYNQILGIDIYNNGFGISTTTRMMTSYYGILRLYYEMSNDKDLSVLKPGDIIFFHNQALHDHIPREDNKYPGHCAIYLSDNDFIHASRKIGRVVISNFCKNEYWKRSLVGSKDIVSDNKLLIKKL